MPITPIGILIFFICKPFGRSQLSNSFPMGSLSFAISLMLDAIFFIPRSLSESLSIIASDKLFDLAICISFLFSDRIYFTLFSISFAIKCNASFFSSLDAVESLSYATLELEPISSIIFLIFSANVISYI